MSPHRVRSLALVGAAAALSVSCSSPATTAVPMPAAQAAPPPVHAGFDYQIGGPYTPPSGVTVVSRDYTVSPAAGLYNICYVNAFQAQPGADGTWDADLLLRDGNGTVVVDEEWGEALLDLRTDAKRRRVAAKVDGWVDQCQAKGFQAVEPDNYDSYERSQGLLSTDDAQAYIRLLSSYAHSKGMAIAQKNTAELADTRVQNGLDFAVVEECGHNKECDTFTAAFGDHIVVVEYTAEGLANACASWGSTLSIVQRDVAVSPAGSSGYVRRAC